MSAIELGCLSVVRHSVAPTWPTRLLALTIGAAISCGTAPATPGTNAGGGSMGAAGRTGGAGSPSGGGRGMADGSGGSSTGGTPAAAGRDGNANEGTAGAAGGRSAGTAGNAATTGSGGSAGTAAGGGRNATPGTGGGRAAGGAGDAGDGGSSGRTGGGGGAGQTGGAAGSTAAGTGGAAVVCGAAAGTGTRPQLTSTEAANFSKLKYLAQTDNWNPTTGLGQASAFSANFTVAADGSGTHTSVQAAVTAASSGTARRYILIKAGTYRGAVSLTGSTPITLYGADADAARVVIVDNQSATSAGSTARSATFTSTADGLQLMNLTISNDFATPPTGTNIQAVALYTTGDKTVLQNVRLHGFQDTLFTDTSSETTPSRVYVKDSFIEGDTDFIFGGATLVIDGGTINYLSSRKTSGGGACLAPSTRTSVTYGFLVVGATFTAADTALPNKVSLGRSWDEGGITPTPNGQAVVRESTLGPHIRKVDPWASAATSARPYSATGNRFSEYCNSGPGAGP